MNLLTVHRVLILTAIVASLALCAYQVWAFTEGEGAAALAIAVFGLLAAAGLAVYLRWFVRKLGK